MEVLTGIKNEELEIHEAADLRGYFDRFAKPRECMRVGIETEFFGIDRHSGQALPFDGPGGIEAILKALAIRFGYAEVYEQDRVIGLTRGDSSVTIEPGGQVELSAPPVRTVFEIEEQVQSFIRELRAIREVFPEMTWLTVGSHPFSRMEDIAWVPKKRYAIMREYFRSHGKLSHYMMKTTATNQVNFDYLSEEHAMLNLRVVLGITSIVTALFSNSPFSEGRPNGFLSRRLDIWNHTDPDRTGLLLDFLEPGRGFADYLDYILDMPVLFIAREANWRPVGDRTFRELIRDGFEGRPVKQADFELHLSTAFPEVRLKSYLEIRGVDCQAPVLMPAVAAFWKGILYDCQTAEAGWDLVKDWTMAERVALHRDVPGQGMNVVVRGRKLLDYARELVDLSCASLGKQTSAHEARSECEFLSRIRNTMIRPGKSPAEHLLEQWEGDIGGDCQRLIRVLEI